MLELLRFVFSDFWHWAGTFVLLAVVGQTLIGVACGLRGHKPRKDDAP